ncbi:hypothetical protein [Nocardia sp. NPDC049149]|uniref:hypothetical protein n=1 Tax=Nocardia sp. NPDC049149 TaxID=3364315 RepID=UPI003723F531
MIGEIANTLRYKTHDVAITKLRKLWRDNEQHRALIEACVPKTDQHQYIPEIQPAATRRPDLPSRPPGRVAHRVDPAKRTDPRQRTGSAAATRVDAYEDQLTAEERVEEGTPRPELIVDRRDYDRDAAVTVTEPLCVSCRLERACIDRWTGQITTGHGDDGLCGYCRDEGRPGIPELPRGHSRHQAIQARLDTIAANFDSHTPDLFRQEWRYGDHLTREVTETWVRQHNPDVAVRPTATTESDELNGECAQCGDWRQLRDDLCVDCHQGLAGDVVIAGTLEPLTIKGVFNSRVINSDAMGKAQAHPPDGTANNARYRDQFLQRLNTGRSEDDGATVKSTHAPNAASSPDPERRNKESAMATPTAPRNAVPELSNDPAARRRQQLRNRGMAATASRGRRI